VVVSLLSIEERSRPMTMYRQGDLLFIREEPRTELPHVRRDTNRRIVLAESTDTGHAHVILDIEARHKRVFSDQFVEVLKEEGVEVVHPEHGPIRLGKGWWKVVRQREYGYRTEERGTRWIAD
jgi:hypothetical protein